MNAVVQLEQLLPDSPGEPQGLALFAFVALGITESLAGGALTVTDAVRVFYHSANGQFVRNRVADPVADEVMSRGVQLPDLFDALPSEEANREFRRELDAIRTLCLRLLEQSRIAA